MLAPTLKGAAVMLPPTGGSPVFGSTNGIKPSGYQPGPKGWLEPPQFGLEEFTYTYCSRNNATLALEMTPPEVFVKFVTDTFTFDKPPLGARTTIWKDSYSPLPAASCACVPLPAGSDGPTLCRLGTTHTMGPLCAFAVPGKDRQAAKAL